ncbi:hypothetical protein [Rhodoferax sp.]|uniref:hypothetical protein n=1 Tax=Rhodoferax sp. TaxID=50421 RepID=UPI0026084B76|nr:hypothetical protein [Rhodoferax sp.]MDD5480802.1 hypothetical protein [Rhodoferax sp.]
MQLDIFNDSRDVMLRNDLLQALQAHDAAQAQAALQKLQLDYPQDLLLPHAQVMLTALHARTQQAQQAGQVVPFTQHAELRAQRVWLLETLAPSARRVMDARAVQAWLGPFWQDLAARAAHLPFASESEQDHAAWLLLQLQDWQACSDAVAQIASWRRIPAPLSWRVQAKLQLHGLRATWPLLAELAWLAPQRLVTLNVATPAPQLQRLMAQFESDWDELEALAPPDAATLKRAADAGSSKAFPWFPAWVLTTQPQHAPDLALAQPGQHSAPEQAMRLLINLLGLEHQGRHHDLVKLRKNLRGLHAGLYAAYMKTR